MGISDATPDAGDKEIVVELVALRTAQQCFIRTCGMRYSARGTSGVVQRTTATPVCVRNIGEAVGELAGFCVAKKRVPREVRAKAELLRESQSQLKAQGLRLAWPK